MNVAKFLFFFFLEFSTSLENKINQTYARTDFTSLPKCKRPENAKSTAAKVCNGQSKPLPIYHPAHLASVLYIKLH